MRFQFQMLGLVVMFLLLIFYWFRKDKYKKEDMVFRYLLLLGYFVCLVDIVCSVAFQVKEYEILLEKLYFILVLGTYSGMTMYYLTRFLKEKYQLQESVFQKKYTKIWLFYGAFFLLQGIGVFCSKLAPFEYEIRNMTNMVPILLGMNLGIGFIILIWLEKKISSRIRYHLWIVYLIEAIFSLLQFFFWKIPLLTTGIVGMMLYLYLTLENMGIEELETLRLEREYNRKHNMDKSAFLKNLSHAIRTPINTIDGFSQMILENDDQEEIKRDVLDIRTASRDLIDVINGMIDLSIIESGNLEIIQENYNVYDMLDSIVEIAHSKLRDKEIEFKVEIDKDIPEVLEGDSERISQVVLNLLKNAIKYTEKGTITLKVDRVRSDTICRLKIMVKDTGKGMKKEELDHLFERENTNSNGIGLAVSKYLIDLMGGSLEVESTDQEGSTFMVTIDQKIISEKQDKKEKKAKEFKPFQATDKKVLVVDDNKLNIKVASRMLAPYGMTVVEASSGQECLDILEKDHEFDLILMDDLMPELSGTETMKLSKKIQRVDGYYIPIVVVTANATSGEKEKYLEVGFEDYLSKPIERDELDRILKKYLKGRNSNKRE